MVAIDDGAMGNFFTAPIILDNLVRKRREGDNLWTFTFGGHSWSPNGLSSIEAMYAGTNTHIDDGQSGTPTRYKLFLEASRRYPLRTGRQSERIRKATSLASRHLIKTCMYIAADTTYRYELNGPNPKSIKRSAIMSIVGIRPRDMGDVTLRQKKFHPIRNPSPLGSYYMFGPELEYAQAAISTRFHRKLERAFAIDFDMEIVNKMLVGLGWSAIELES